MAYDIGISLFVDLLGMTQYPGQPFTGNIYRDLIMFLIVPTIFIIMVLYIMSGRIIPNRNFRLMIGVGAYLFILAGGYYSFFALLSGPYFIFLIFILGVLGYLGSHFRTHGGGGGYSRGHGHSYAEEGGGVGYSRKINPLYRRKIDKEIERLGKELAVAETQLAKAEKGGHDRAIQDAQADVRRIRTAIRDLEDEKKLDI